MKEITKKERAFPSKQNEADHVAEGFGGLGDASAQNPDFFRKFDGISREEYKKRHKLLYRKKYLQKKITRDELIEDFNAFVSQNPEEAPALERQLAEVFARISSSQEKQDQSAQYKPRAKWSDETKKTNAEGRRNPIQFVFDLYRDDLDAGRLTRADIRQLDRQLYQAIATWVRRHSPLKSSETDENDLEVWAIRIFGTSVKERVDNELQSLGINSPSDAFERVPDRREAERLYSAAKRRQLRS